MEDRIAEDNPVRVIDGLVESLNLKRMGFINEQPGYKEGDRADKRDKGGRPCYHARDLLKVFGEGVVLFYFLGFSRNVVADYDLFFVNV